MLPLTRARFGDEQPTDSALNAYYRELGFFAPPPLNLPVAFDTQAPPMISPLQAVLAAAALSHNGVIPAPRIATAINTLEQGWVVLPAEGTPREALQAEAANQAAAALIVQGKAYWSHVGQSSLDDGIITWLVAGTLPDWQGTPLALVVTLEENNTFLANHIGDTLLDAALNQ